jgi:BirA family biotin operon repressor/biotin-[acetyl-CoA-carboxylase] ligase|tara:strand:+ start:32 stop:616 length:585 start_codon:yes stop_codon:yes gene_type:complete
MKFEIFKFEKVTSTNEVAIHLIKEKQKEIGCVYADTQTKGRGTHGRTWISDKGNLFGTLFFPLEDNYPPFNEFSIINPIIISDVIKHFCYKESVNLKFPNDVFVNGKKICGVLQETITLDARKFLIIGIGVNIISNPDINDEYKATNILLETKKKPGIEDIIDLIISSYEKFFVDLNLYNYESLKKKAESMVLN